MRQRVRTCVLGTAALAFVLSLPASVLAQGGRVTGVVRDEGGEPIQGATVVAENPQASPSSFSSVTDERGRFAMLGLKAGTWTFTASAPGFVASQGSTRIQTLGSNPPITFTLAKGGPAAGGGALAGVDTKELQAELQTAETLMAAGQHDQAIEAYKGILEKAPALTAINFEIGRAYRLKKDYDSALKAYEAVLAADPSNERATIEIGMTNLEKGDFEAADTTLTAAAEMPGASREVFYNLAEVKFSKQETDEAEKLYQKAADADPKWGRPVFKLGLVALNKGDTQAAIKHFEHVIEIDPTSPEATQAKAVIEQLKKQ